MAFSVQKSLYPHDEANRIGVWGPATSTLDWCEENHIVSPYIAEYFNTLSNLNYIFLGLLGLYSCYSTRSELRNYLSVGGAILTIGTGSFLFHMTLLYEMQLCDELPMLYGYAKASAIGLFCYCIIITAVYMYTRIPQVFQVAYALMVLTATFYPWIHISKLRETHPTEADICKRLMYLSITGYLTGFVFWNIDNEFCLGLRELRLLYPAIGWISQGHMWWHFFTGFGGFVGAVHLHYMRMIVLGRKDIKLTWIAWYPIVWTDSTEKKTE